MPEALVFQVGVAPRTEVRTLLFCLLRSQKAPGIEAQNNLRLILHMGQSPQVELLPALSGRVINNGTPEPAAAPIVGLGLL